MNKDLELSLPEEYDLEKVSHTCQNCMYKLAKLDYRNTERILADLIVLESQGSDEHGSGTVVASRVI